ncbi:MAG: TlyA family RNA methyltransferase [Clostridia bacterium]|nr:TlyA family RNA methyltransferase [Clostridia bacterium]
MAIMRVDEALVANGLADCIDEARLLIMEGKVFLGAGMVTKPSDKAKPHLQLTVKGQRRRFVSRGGMKLEKALDVFKISVADRICVDIGASTGGFTDVMLKSGAKTVYAVDVGFGLLDWSIRNDPRVVVMERTNARNLNGGMFDIAPSFGATDVSFISLKAVLPRAFDILEGEREFVALVKPQFEARKEQVSAGGIVRSREVHIEVLRDIINYIYGRNWTVAGIDFSPITGTNGNIEFLLHILPHAEPIAHAAIEECVCKAWLEHMAQ